PKDGKKTLWPELAKIFGKPGVAFDLQEMKDRILFRQAIETARCLDEGVLTTVHDGNIGSIYGIVFPAWTCAELQFINAVGVKKFVERADTLAAKYGARFAPPKLLREKAARDASLS